MSKIFVAAVAKLVVLFHHHHWKCWSLSAFRYDVLHSKFLFSHVPPLPKWQKKPGYIFSWLLVPNYTTIFTLSTFRCKKIGIISNITNVIFLGIMIHNVLIRNMKNIVSVKSCTIAVLIFRISILAICLECLILYNT